MQRQINAFADHMETLVKVGGKLPSIEKGRLQLLAIILSKAKSLEAALDEVRSRFKKNGLEAEGDDLESLTANLIKEYAQHDEEERFNKW